MRRQITQQVKQPAAGADWTFVPSTSDSVRLLAITAKLVTSATVDSRVVVLQATDIDGNLLDAFPATAAQAASKTVTYVWDNSASGISASEDDLTLSQSVPNFWLPPGATVASATALLQAGDQWSDVVATFLSTDRWRMLEVGEAIDQLIDASG